MQLWGLNARLILSIPMEETVRAGRRRTDWPRKGLKERARLQTIRRASDKLPGCVWTNKQSFLAS